MFLDANVLFTAAHRSSHGKAAFLFQMRAEGSAPWHLPSSAYAIEEARRNLAIKFPSMVDDFGGLLKQVDLVLQPATPMLSLHLPAKDQPIWAAALAAKATHLLTGDLRDFGPYMNRPDETAGTIIQTVADYLKSLPHSS